MDGKALQPFMELRSERTDCNEVWHCVAERDIGQLENRE